MKFFKYIPLITLFLFACSSEDGGASYDSFSETGQAGSLARFTIANNYLYTVEIDKLKIFNVTNDSKPEFVKQINPGFDIETIFSKDNLLFLGSRWGVYIYDITDPDDPDHLSTYDHLYSCDPVVVSGNYAYATLSSGSPCSFGGNQLDIIDVSDPENPKQVNEIAMQNPKGLGISGNLLFVCDEGIKVYSIEQAPYPEYIRTVSVDAFDVIPLDDLLLVASESGLYEYSFTETGELTLLSTLYAKK